MTVIVNSRRDFTLENYRRVMLGGESLKVGPRAKKAMTDARKSFRAFLESDPTQFIYGVTSGFGPQAKTAVSPEEQRKHAERTNPTRQTGAGFGTQMLPDRVVRGIIFSLLSSLIEGHGKVRPAIAERLAAMLDRPLPEVPLSGQVGAGEILPLAHVLSAMPEGDWEEGEPGALFAGSSATAGLIADVALVARRRLELAEQVFCLSIEAMRAPLEAYDPDLVHLWGDPYEGEAIRRINALLRGGAKDRRFYQAPVSWRILPRVLGAARRAVATAEEVAGYAIASVNGNPTYVLPTKQKPLGYTVSNGGYHNGTAYPAIDSLNAAYADLVTLADHHTTKMQNTAVSELPNYLTKGEGFGTAILGFIQIGFGEEARHAAQRTFLPPSEGGGYGQNDVASPTFFAYQKHLTANRCFDSAMAILATVASQALWVTERKAPPQLAAFLDGVRSIVRPFDGKGERNTGRELERLATALGDGALTGAFPPPRTKAVARSRAKVVTRKPAPRPPARPKPVAGRRPAPKRTAAKRPAAKRGSPRPKRG